MWRGRVQIDWGKRFHFIPSGFNSRSRRHMALLIKS